MRQGDDRQVLIYRLRGMSRRRLSILWWRASVIFGRGPSSLDQKKPAFRVRPDDEA